MGSRVRGQREPGSMTPQQLVAGRLAGILMRFVYGADYAARTVTRALTAIARPRSTVGARR